METLWNYMGEYVESQRRLAERDEFFFRTNTSHITRFTAHVIIQFRPTEYNDIELNLSWFGHFLRSLKELTTRNVCFECKNEKYVSL